MLVSIICVYNFVIEVRNNLTLIDDDKRNQNVLEENLNTFVEYITDSNK